MRLSSESSTSIVAPAASVHSVEGFASEFFLQYVPKQVQDQLVTTLIPGTFSSCVLAYTISSQRFGVLLRLLSAAVN